MAETLLQQGQIDGLVSALDGKANWHIGQIVPSTLPITDAGLHLLDGTLISGSGTYAAFVDYIGDLYDSGDYPAVFDTEANWQAAVTAYGVCGKFVYDSVNNTVRLPKITGIIEGTTDTTALGDLVAAGLPNITGAINNGYKSESDGAGTGCLSAVNTGLHNIGGGSGWQTSNISFDASRSSSIYGNSSTVQPQTIKVLYYIVIATTTKIDIQADIDEIATDLNLKAETDLSNLTTAGNIYGSKLSMPSSVNENLTLGASGTSYTAPSNGYFYLSATTTAQNGYCFIHNLTSGLENAMQPYPSGFEIRVIMMAEKGDTVQITYGSINASAFKFIYSEGSKTEAN